MELKKRRLYHLLQYAHKLSKLESERKPIKKKTRFNDGKLILRTLPTHSDNYLNSFDYRARVAWNRLDKCAHGLGEIKLFNDYILRNIDVIFDSTRD